MSEVSMCPGVHGHAPGDSCLFRDNHLREAERDRNICTTLLSSCEGVSCKKTDNFFFLFFLDFFYFYSVRPYRDQPGII